MGFGVTNPYKMVIYINKYVIYIGLYELVYPIGIKRVRYINYIGLAIVPSWGKGEPSFRGIPHGPTLCAEQCLQMRAKRKGLYQCSMGDINHIHNTNI